jgi:hypothetical protein
MPINQYDKTPSEALGLSSRVVDFGLQARGEGGKGENSTKEIW